MLASALRASPPELQGQLKYIITQLGSGGRGPLSVHLRFTHSSPSPSCLSLSLSDSVPTSDDSGDEGDDDDEVM